MAKDTKTIKLSYGSKTVAVEIFIQATALHVLQVAGFADSLAAGMTPGITNPATGMLYSPAAMLYPLVSDGQTLTVVKK